MSRVVVQFGRISFAVVASGIIAALKPAATKVYLILSAHVDSNWTASVGLERLQNLTGLSRQSVVKGIRQLEEVNLITVQRGGGRSRTNTYYLQTNCQPDLTDSPQINGQHQLTLIAEKLSTPEQETVNERTSNCQPPLTRTDRTGLNISSTEEKAIPKPTKQERDAMWEAICSTFSINPQTKAEKSRVGKLTRDFLLKHATPDELEIRLARLTAEWGHKAATPESMLKHWDRFGGASDDLCFAWNDPTDEECHEIARRHNKHTEASRA